MSDAGPDAPATDVSVLEDDGGASEVGLDTGNVSGPEVGADASVDSPIDTPVEEVGDALSLDGEAGNCYQAIKDNGYAAGAAAPCSSCMENTLSRENDCKAILDCLAAAGMSCEGNCRTGCFNQGEGGSVTATCVDSLIAAACP